MKKSIIKSICFFLILFFILFSTSYLLSHKKVVHGINTTLAGIELEKENSIDYFVLGDSETYTSIIPLEIYHNYGYTGYILGTPAQRLNQTKEILISSLEHQNPKVLILETNAIFRKNKTKDPKTSIKNIFTDLYQLHDNWKYYISPRYKIYSGNEKGYKYTTKIKKAPYRYKPITEEKAEIPDYNIDVLEFIIDLCKEKDMKLILVSTPTSKNWTYKKHNSLVDLSEKYNVPFIDLNLDKSLNIDWNHDTQDEGDHLNYFGAYKTTKIFSKYLSEFNYLEDHRGDKEYSDWDDYYKRYVVKFSK